MKIFIIQRVSGEDKDKLRKESQEICSILTEKNHSISCTMLENESFENRTKSQIFDHAFKEIDNCDVILAIVRSEEKSEGLLMEIGYSIAKKKKIILAVKNAVKDTHLRDLIEETIEFDNTDDLLNKLNKLEL
jgi:nucleoside 2-deoxyribosyltransferase